MLPLEVVEVTQAPAPFETLIGEQGLGEQEKVDGVRVLAEHERAVEAEIV